MARMTLEMQALELLFYKTFQSEEAYRIWIDSLSASAFPGDSLGVFPPRIVKKLRAKQFSERIGTKHVQQQFGNE